MSVLCYGVFEICLKVAIDLNYGQQYITALAICISLGQLPILYLQFRPVALSKGAASQSCIQNFLFEFDKAMPGLPSMCYTVLSCRVTFQHPILFNILKILSLVVQGGLRTEL